MRLYKKQSTKAERKFADWLNRNRIPFKYKQKINGREIDFIIGRYAIEIDGHKQDPFKNHLLFQQGFIPLHIQNKEIKNICLEQIFSPLKLLL